MTITKEITLYSFDELSDKAKEKAINKIRYSESYLDWNWYDYTIEDFTNILETIGFNDVKIGFSVFYSQGGGAHFTGSYRYKAGALAHVKKEYPKYEALHTFAKELQELESKDFYSIRFKISHNGHYQHENCTSFDFEDIRNNYGYTNQGFNEDGYMEACRSFMQEIYSSLKKEYDYLMEDEQIIDFINNHEFLYNEFGGIA